MRQRIFISLAFIVMLGVLIALNAATYVQEEEERESEWNPDRSTYHGGVTGVRALYDYLNEAGYKAQRWREPLTKLKADGGANQPATLVIIGNTKRPLVEDETRALLNWVAKGGRLVLVDRSPEIELLPTSGVWRVAVNLEKYPTADARPGNPQEMTAGVALARPVQPTLLTQDVDSVLPSRFASLLASNADATPTPTPTSGRGYGVALPPRQSNSNAEEPYAEDEPPPPPAIRNVNANTRTRPPPPVAVPHTATTKPNNSAPQPPAPVVHLGDYRGALLLDYPHGQGRIVVLTDPFIVANNGINLADNLLLATNIMAGAGRDKIIAFDEYHQGRSATSNALFAYFKGTPIIALLAQGALIVLVILFSQGRRFARPLPVVQIDRRSKLEFVASMAELQERARAFDLALENLYARVRRVMVRYAGVSYDSPRDVIAERVAERSHLNKAQLKKLMHDCEEAINGAPLNGKRALKLAAQLREVESALTLNRNRTTNAV